MDFIDIDIYLFIDLKILLLSVNYLNKLHSRFDHLWYFLPQGLGRRIPVIREEFLAKVN